MALYRILPYLTFWASACIADVLLGITWLNFNGILFFIFQTDYLQMKTKKLFHQFQLNVMTIRKLNFLNVIITMKFIYGKVETIENLYILSLGKVVNNPQIGLNTTVLYCAWSCWEVVCCCLLMTLGAIYLKITSI